jgi:hypothetical protein
VNAKLKIALADSGDMISPAVRGMSPKSKLKHRRAEAVSGERAVVHQIAKTINVLPGGFVFIGMTCILPFTFDSYSEEAVVLSQKEKLRMPTNDIPSNNPEPSRALLATYEKSKN